jgi:hypothetical protein
VYLRSVAFALLTALASNDGRAQSAGSAVGGSYVCNFARMKRRSERGASAVVLSGAGRQFRTIDHVHRNTPLYICDELEGWFKVFYSGPNGPCSSVEITGLDVQKTKGCRSGWIEKKWVQVISG